MQAGVMAKANPLSDNLLYITWTDELQGSIASYQYQSGDPSAAEASIFPFPMRIVVCGDQERSWVRHIHRTWSISTNPPIEGSRFLHNFYQ